MQKRNLREATKEKYKVFTNEYDEIAKAEDLETKDEIIRLRKNLDSQLTNLQNIVSKLANKLQRKLLAKQNRSWEFDLEEGILDAAKLSRVIVDPLRSLSPNYQELSSIPFTHSLTKLRSKPNLKIPSLPY